MPPIAQMPEPPYYAVILPPSVPRVTTVMLKRLTV